MLKTEPGLRATPAVGKSVKVISFLSFFPSSFQLEDGKSMRKKKKLLLRSSGVDSTSGQDNMVGGGHTDRRGKE